MIASGVGYLSTWYERLDTAADCAIHERDRLEGWFNLSRKRSLTEHLAREIGEQAITRPVLELER